MLDSTRVPESSRVESGTRVDSSTLVGTGYIARRKKFSHSSWREWSFVDVRIDDCVPLNRYVSMFRARRVENYLMIYNL